MNDGRMVITVSKNDNQQTFHKIYSSEELIGLDEPGQAVRLEEMQWIGFKN
jgi:hypothetical protein